MTHFGCSKRKVDDTRSLDAVSKGVKLPEPKQQTRNKLNIVKCEHFLDFVFYSGLLQDVVYYRMWHME